VTPFGTVCELPQAPTQNGCDMGEVCVPTPGGNTGECIMLTGDQNCPSPYTNKTVGYATVNDTRVCECNCGTEDGTCGEATLELYNDSSCGGSPLVTSTASGDCFDASGYNGHDSYMITGGAYTAGTCSVQEVDTGEVTVSDLRTICCQP
jgi:hypothetical protein